jgi:hypothetical protein
MFGLIPLPSFVNDLVVRDSAGPNVNEWSLRSDVQKKKQRGACMAINSFMVWSNSRMKLCIESGCFIQVSFHHIWHDSLGNNIMKLSTEIGLKGNTLFFSCMLCSNYFHAWHVVIIHAELIHVLVLEMKPLTPVKWERREYLHSQINQILELS